MLQINRANFSPIFMYDKQAKGKLGEAIAVKYLLSAGYTSIQTRIKVSYNEIDILANFGEKVVFIEVKLRTNIEKFTLEEAVSKFKLRKFKWAILAYISRKSIINYQADLILIYLYSDKACLKHYQNIALP